MNGDPLSNFEDYAAPNWGGEGEKPVTTTAVSMTRKVIAALQELGEPDACPGADGSIGLEWNLGGESRLFVDVREVT